MKQRFFQWWYGLASREQRLVLIAVPLVILGVFYWLIWQPLHQAKQQNVVALQQMQQQLIALQQAKPLLQLGDTSPERVGGSLAQIISNSARSFNIRVSRMQPQNDQLQLVLDDIAYAQLLPWLHQLQYQNAVRLVSLDIGVTDKPGIVRVRRMVIE
ncbi:type II secretion system protein M [Alishewanella sp. 16-MA]|uniref:Type II secretion system protein M n=1 Tax=Alishewanella maricola TaxID=2795740 RepID=A0ABS8C4J7_9ALTE|nr:MULTISPECIES: type II secretion system protein M [Alishewanella]MDP4945595.1 type II secretion system protein M [Alishewanella sp.]MCB5227245.1 type II secretion system protein M [Alishewanella maricola]MDP5035831.1 type II secretion system protein M [Alishewanella sp.]MDP5186943.1 type II secretion system protein M [Alishewanella sp.]MDP5460528.1 type II secretion system protein M [Alishewanella sp. SMS8]